ncbi:tyrosine phosphatase family-domain-containing protein [Aspergillus floccosus]
MKIQPASNEENPFIQVEGVFNVRQFGGYPSTLFPNARTRQNFLYRSGHLEDITVKGQRTLKEDLWITAIFDLRSKDESAVCTELGFYDGTPVPRSMLGCEKIKLPIQRGSYSFKQRVDKYAKLNINPESVSDDYLAMARDGAGAVQSILLYILEHPNSPLLIHCKVGKDRTGVVFAIILSLAGVPDEIVAAEYSLSTLGLYPAKPNIRRYMEATKSDIKDIDASVLLFVSVPLIKALLKTVTTMFPLPLFLLYFLFVFPGEAQIGYDAASNTLLCSKPGGCFCTHEMTRAHQSWNQNTCRLNRSQEITFCLRVFS